MASNSCLKYQRFIYGITIDSSQYVIDFDAGGGEISAFLTVGYYTLQGLCREIKRAMEATDPLNIYTCTVDRNVSSGTQQILTISTNGAQLDLLFNTGTNTSVSAAPVMGFTTAADLTGSTTYTAPNSIGTNMLPELPMYNYYPPQFMVKQNGTVNIAANGSEEAIIFATWQFTQMDFKYMTRGFCYSDWQPFLTWASLKKPFEFIAWDADPNAVFEVTLESSSMDGKGLGYQLKEMLPKFPGLYQTDTLKFRIEPATVPITGAPVL